jgi:hypothetical protein
VVVDGGFAELIFMHIDFEFIRGVLRSVMMGHHLIKSQSRVRGVVLAKMVVFKRVFCDREGVHILINLGVFVTLFLGYLICGSTVDFMLLLVVNIGIIINRRVVSLIL